MSTKEDSARKATLGGTAAQAGKLEKDEHHDSNVSSYGCLFYPLVVESYGVWPEHSLELLNSVAKSLMTNGSGEWTSHCPFYKFQR